MKGRREHAHRKRESRSALSWGSYVQLWGDLESQMWPLWGQTMCRWNGWRSIRTAATKSVIFVCSVTVRQCHGISIFQTHPVKLLLCCTAERGSLDSTSTAEYPGLAGKSVLTSWKLWVIERFMLACWDVVPPMLATSQDYPKQISSYFSGHTSGHFCYLIWLCEVRAAYIGQVMWKNSLTYICWNVFLNWWILYRVKAKGFFYLANQERGRS